MKGNVKGNKMNPLADIGMSDEIYEKFKSRFVIKEYFNEDGLPIICPNCTSGEPVSLHHVFGGFDRTGKLIHDYGTQGMFSCYSCSQRRVYNCMKKHGGDWGMKYIKNKKKFSSKTTGGNETS